MGVAGTVLDLYDPADDQPHTAAIVGAIVDGNDELNASPSNVDAPSRRPCRDRSSLLGTAHSRFGHMYARNAAFTPTARAPPSCSSIGCCPALDEWLAEASQPANLEATMRAVFAAADDAPDLDARAQAVRPHDRRVRPASCPSATRLMADHRTIGRVASSVRPERASWLGGRNLVGSSSDESSRAGRRSGAARNVGSGDR